jgi:cytochrome c oxidase subunit 2
MLYSLQLVATPPTVATWTTLFNYYAIFGTAAGVVVIAYMVFNIVKNRARSGRKVPAFHEEKGDWGNWKGVVFTLCITGGVLAFVEYETFASASLIQIPNGPSVAIGVTAQQYAWSFTYPNGYINFQNLTVPAGQIITLNITSMDVTHGFFIPALDVGKDAQPKIHNQLWFNATETGVFPIDCRQLCGVGHATMLSKLVVLPADQYSAWYAKLPAAPGKGGA